eukprot:Polyplicarium_translucidae@DN2488_c0_g1_i3.p1
MLEELKSPHSTIINHPTGRILWRIFAVPFFICCVSVGCLFRRTLDAECRVTYLPPTRTPTYPCPKVFKYELPGEWLTNRIGAEADGPFPDPFGPPLFPDAQIRGLYSTQHMSIASLMENALGTYGSECSTDDPHEADLFFIPWYRNWDCLRFRKCSAADLATSEEKAVFKYIRTTSRKKHGTDFFRRNGGWDHFVLVPMDSFGGFVPKDLKFRRGNYANVTTASVGFASTIYYPYPTWAHFEPGLENFPWQARHLMEDLVIDSGTAPKSLQEMSMVSPEGFQGSPINSWYFKFPQRENLACVAASGFSNLHPNAKRVVLRAKVLHECQAAERCAAFEFERKELHENELAYFRRIALLYRSSTFRGF